jgi:hypothetical protein
MAEMTAGCCVAFRQQAHADMSFLPIIAPI